MSFCIYTAANGYYLGYVDLFKYCAKRAFPDAVVIVDENDNVPVPYYSACSRLLNNPGEYDYVYITDVDMMMLKTNPSADMFHIQNMQKTGLPYSNTPRDREVRGSERMTGLHFASKEWYAKTCVERGRYMGMVLNGKYGKNRIDDELMLMDIVRKSGLEISPRHQLTSLHFGIHIGTVRAYQHKSRETMRQQLSSRISPEYARQWVELMADPKFKALLLNAGRENHTIGKELMVIESFCRRRAVE